MPQRSLHLQATDVSQPRCTLRADSSGELARCGAEISAMSANVKAEGSMPSIGERQNYDLFCSIGHPTSQEPLPSIGGIRPLIAPTPAPCSGGRTARAARASDLHDVRLLSS